MTIVFKNGKEITIHPTDSNLFNSLCKQMKENKKQFVEFQDEEEAHLIFDIKEVMIIQK